MRRRTETDQCAASLLINRKLARCTETISTGRYTHPPEHRVEIETKHGEWIVLRWAYARTV
jgi:hypothetical protein